MDFYNQNLLFEGTVSILWKIWEFTSDIQPRNLSFPKRKATVLFLSGTIRYHLARDFFLNDLYCLSQILKSQFQRECIHAYHTLRNSCFLSFGNLRQMDGHGCSEDIWLEPKHTPLMFKQRGYIQLLMAHPTMMGPWLTGIISSLSGMDTSSLIAHFLPPHVFLQRKRQERSRPLAQFRLFLLFPLPNTLSVCTGFILDSWIPIKFQGKGKYSFLHILLAKKLMLSTFYCSTHHLVWTGLKARMKMCILLCPVSFKKLCTKTQYQRLCTFARNIGSKLIVIPKTVIQECSGTRKQKVKFRGKKTKFQYMS